MSFYDTIANHYEIYDRGMTGTDPLDYITPQRNAQDRVLILGGGGGREVRRLARSGASMTAIDNSQAMLDLIGEEPHLTKVQQDIFGGPLPFRDDSFDFVFALHGLLTICPEKDQLKRLVLEVGRTLTPGGLFVCEVPQYSYGQDGDLETEDFLAQRVENFLTLLDKRSGASTSHYLRPMGEWLEILSCGDPGLKVKLDTVGSEWRIECQR